ncbi:MAG: hypothetical protein ABIW83_08690 [Allosphingosinicella sp.]
MAGTYKYGYEPTFDTAFAEEIGFVKARWSAKELRRGVPEGSVVFDTGRLRGLALSGGGIRSASFCMGVVQQLHRAGIIDRLHYMSTVSGGGFTGASLSWFLSWKPQEGKRFGTELDNFPFTGGEPAGVRNASVAISSKTEAPIDGRTVLDYIRQRASYLNPGAGFTIVSALAILLRSVLTSVIGFVLLMAIFAQLILHLGLFRENLGEAGVSLPPALAPLASLDVLAAAGLFMLGALGVTVILYSLFTGLPHPGKWDYALRRTYQKVAGFLLGLGIALLLLSLLHIVIDWLGGNHVRGDLPTLGTLSTALGAVGGLSVRSLRDAKPSVLTGLAMALLPPVSLFLLVAGIGVLGHEIASYVVQAGYKLEIAFLIATLAYCVLTNINLTGLHRFYRDRLMESFMPDPEDIRGDLQAAETSADDKALADICGMEDDGPYHLINTHVVLLGAKKARLRSREGDAFVMSRLYCGSEATGFIPTQAWLPGPAWLAMGKRVGAMRLPTAMAISGAALNPRAGADGQGATKGGAVSALLNLLNLRLGYWVPSPRKLGAGGFLPSYRAPPNFIFPGLFQGLFGFFHNENANWLELTDGGHFENTGIYELVRRRVRTIIFADGSTDPEIALQSFANVLEKIYIDFNVAVDFADKDAHFTSLMKGTGMPQDNLAQKLQFAGAGYAVGTIRYPKIDGREQPGGVLIYIKSTMVRDLPVALYSYKATNPLFPSESLADQFFSEQQFEAYRALGFALTKSMVEKAKATGDWAAALGLPDVPPAPAS